MERIFPTGNKIEEMGKSSQLEKEKPTYQLPPERIHLRDSLIKERLDVLKHFRDKRKNTSKIEKN
ncbi:MAG: hypothetical protein HWD61_13055 [Parachlamydiaceae bacterium]|nr:MAG: hypothetical protein HWD61_13055 [Parachlamydiaceae bacterium]